MAYRISLRCDTAANWTSVDPILALAEAGYETDTGKLKFGNGTDEWSALSYWTGSSGSVTGPGSSTDNSIVRFDGTSGGVLQNSNVQIDDDGNAEFNNKDLRELKNALFNGEYDNGNSGSAKTVNFNAGQKQKLTLSASSVAITCTFPGVGNYVLRLIQHASTPATAITLATTGGSSLLPAGSLTVKAGASTVTVLSIYYDGTNATYTSIPDVKTGTVTVA